MSRVPLILRLLVRLYPPEFRDLYGESMLSFQRQRLAEASRLGESRWRVWRRAVVDIVVTAALEWIRALSGRRAALHTYPAPRRSLEERMSIIGQELVQSVRSLRRSVGFSLAAIVTLALGISSTTAIFSVVHTVLLAPLPFPDADRVVVPESKKVSSNDTWTITYADFMDWRDNQVFAQVALYQDTQMDINGSSDPVRVRAAAVTPQFFGAIGVRPAKGRTLGVADYPVNAPRAVMISDRLWRAQFGSRPDIVGLTVEINAIKRSIVGVLPPGVRWPLEADLWVPFRLSTEQDPDLQRRQFRVQRHRAPQARLDARQHARDDGDVGPARRHRTAEHSEGHHDGSNADSSVDARQNDAARAVDSPRRRRASVAHRLCERRQPAARTGGRAAS